MQRLFDVFFSLLAILFLSPFFLSIIFILSITGEREIFFIQNRVGKNKINFGLLKFVTMRKDSETSGAGTITLKNDSRVLPFGKFLRKSKLNELPQLFNILVGHMSIIGPRPLHKKQFLFYSENNQKIISSIRPGLSGISSIIFRDEERLLDGREDPIRFYNENITPHKSDLELWFVKNNTLLLYIKIIFVTAWVVVFPASNIVDKAFDGIPNLPDSLI